MKKKKRRCISVASVIFKLWGRNIKLLEVGRVMKVSKEKTFHLKAVRKIAPWFPAAVKAAKAHFNDCQSE